MKNSAWIATAVIVLVTLGGSAQFANAQEFSISEKSRWAIDLWSGGGSGISGPDKGNNLWLSGIRFSRTIWQDRNGGSLQYGVEIIPAFLIYQEPSVYGFEATPVLLRWNFNSTRLPVSPFLEFGAGILLTDKEVPENTSDVNFTPQAAAGVRIFTAEKGAATISFRFMHISNAGMESPNPGMNSLQLAVGYTWFL